MIIVLAIFPPPMTGAILLYVPGIALIIVAVTATNIVLGLLGARFRDFSYGVRMIMMPMFFVTPILWIPDMLSGPRVWLAQLTPFTHFLAIIREPLLGRVPSLTNYGVVIVITLLLVLLGLRLLGRHRWKVPYWIA